MERVESWAGEDVYRHIRTVRFHDVLFISTQPIMATHGPEPDILKNCLMLNRIQINMSMRPLLQSKRLATRDMSRVDALWDWAQCCHRDMLKPLLQVKSRHLEVLNLFFPTVSKPYASLLARFPATTRKYDELRCSLVEWMQTAFDESGFRVRVLAQMYESEEEYKLPDFWWKKFHSG